MPSLDLGGDSLKAMIAVLGTTISPYLFFWQASQETEDIKASRDEQRLKKAPGQAEEAVRPHPLRHLPGHGL